MRKRLSNLTAKVTVLILMFAFATSGFAHRMASPQDTQAAQAAAVLGMQLSDICGGTGDAPASVVGCEVCLLAAGSDLPPVLFVLAQLGASNADQSLPQRAIAQHICTANPAHPVRAPPFV